MTAYAVFDYPVLDIFLALAVGSLLLAAFLNRRHRRELLSLCLALSILLHFFSLCMMGFANLSRKNPAHELQPKFKIIALKVATQRQKESIARQRLRAELPRRETADRHADMQTERIEMPRPLHETSVIPGPLPTPDSSPSAERLDLKQPALDARKQPINPTIKPTDAAAADAFEIKLPAKPVAVEIPRHDTAAPTPKERLDSDRAVLIAEPSAPNAAPKPRLEQDIPAQSRIVPRIEIIETKERPQELKDAIQSPDTKLEPDRVEIRINAFEQAKENDTAPAPDQRPIADIKPDKHPAGEQTDPGQPRHLLALPAILPHHEAKSMAVETPDGIDIKQTRIPEQTAAANPAIQPHAPVAMGSAPKMLAPFVQARPEISRETQAAHRALPAQKEKQLEPQSSALNVKPNAPPDSAERAEELHSAKIEKVYPVAIDFRRQNFIHDKIVPPLHEDSSLATPTPSASAMELPSEHTKKSSIVEAAPLALSTSKHDSYRETAILPERPDPARIPTATEQGGGAAPASTLAAQLEQTTPAARIQAPAPQDSISQARSPAQNAGVLAPAIAANAAKGIPKPATDIATGAITRDSHALAVSKIAVSDAPALSSRPSGTAMDSMRIGASAERAPGHFEPFSDAGFSMPRSAQEIPVEISAQPVTRFLLSEENAPQLRFAPEKAIYKMRKPERRKQFIETLGGTPLTEEAVESALQWLSRAQSDDGRWDVDGFKTLDECGGAGDLAGEDVAVTGLALLAFLGAGYTHLEGIHKDAVLKGLEWLLSSEEENGDFRGTGRMYGQAIATVVLCEAYSLTADKRLLASAERATRFIINAQVPGSGWQYGPADSSDTSVTGWQILALKSAGIAGIAVPEQTFKWTQQWLDQVRQGKEGGLYSSRPMHPVTHVMTAEGLFCQLFMNEQTRARGQKESIAYINSELPRWDERSNAIHMYYWYYAILSLYLSGADEFKTWNDALTTALLQGQKKIGSAAGSWDPVGQLGPRGGRVYSTAIAALCLEVYYRFLPLYMRNSD